MFSSRVATTPDVNRISKALERPGIDPRLWICVAYVTKFSIDVEGPLVDVLLMPDRIPETFASFEGLTHRFRAFH